MRVHKMTKWDAGQVLIKASDTLFESATELRETYPEFSEMLHHMGCEIGTAFNKFRSHVFGLRGLEDCKCPKCTEKQTSGDSRDENVKELAEAIRQAREDGAAWQRKRDAELAYQNKWQDGTAIAQLILEQDISSSQYGDGDNEKENDK